MARMGRPPVEIDKNTFEGLCKILCTELEICDIFDCSPDTLCRWCKKQYKKTFAEIYKRFSSNGKASIRRMQFKQGAKSPAMAIWLGKIHLGQREETNTAISVDFEDLTPLADLIKNDKDSND